MLRGSTFLAVALLGVAALAAVASLMARRQVIRPKFFMLPQISGCFWHRPPPQGPNFPCGGWVGVLLSV